MNVPEYYAQKFENTDLQKLCYHVSWNIIVQTSTDI